MLLCLWSMFVVVGMLFEGGYYATVHCHTDTRTNLQEVSAGERVEWEGYTENGDAHDMGTRSRARVYTYRPQWYLSLLSFTRAH